ncbi:hypothetical protein AAG570_007682 [Ranatra chinensis]|uniref:Uncharacterized protein n=1 Tax=Ranatra chinensis TaxID=642074 RepID=A0ABD0Y7H2_9HEMI
MTKFTSLLGAIKKYYDGRAKDKPRLWRCAVYCPRRCGDVLVVCKNQSSGSWGSAIEDAAKDHTCRWTGRWTGGIGQQCPLELLREIFFPDRTAEGIPEDEKPVSFQFWKCSSAVKALISSMDAFWKIESQAYFPEES